MKNKLTEGVDYYLNDEGLIVLTEAYHLDRGHCCGSGCKHCPFEYDRVAEPRKSWLLGTLKKQDIK